MNTIPRTKACYLAFHIKEFLIKYATVRIKIKDSARFLRSVLGNPAPL